MRAFYIVATLLALALLGALAYFSWRGQEEARQEKARQAREACEKRNSEKGLYGIPEDCEGER
jgi:hypothetical protein